jgi:hypothetical protein
MAILLERRQASTAPVATTSPLTGTPSVIAVSPIVYPTALTNSSTVPSSTSSKTIAPGLLAVAIVGPLLVILALVFIYLYTRRRTNSAQSNNAQSTSRSPPNTGTTVETNSSTPTTTQSRRDERRARRLRRTDSGGTVKTLPEYNELGEDEILLSKSVEAVARRGSTRSREASSHQSEANLESVSRRSSLTAVLRRLSLRRSEPQSPTEDESNEMEDMIERATLNSVTEDVGMSPIGEERTLPDDDTPQYDQLYPTLPPQIQIHQDDSEVDLREPTTSSIGRRTRGLRSMFRRQATSMDATQRHANMSSSGELGLSMTESNDLSLYRPSTSSSRSMVFGGSSLSLLSQAGNESNDTLGRNTLPRRQHIRNISAPISTRRLQLAPPVAGFSDQQMQFLTSVESLDKYGVPVDHATGEQQQLPPPSFEELAREEERLEQQPLRHLAPILTSAERVARSERSPLSPTLLTTVRSPVETPEVAARTSSAPES